MPPNPLTSASLNTLDPLLVVKAGLPEDTADPLRWWPFLSHTVITGYRVEMVATSKTLLLRRPKATSLQKHTSSSPP